MSADGWQGWPGYDDGTVETRPRRQWWTPLVWVLDGMGGFADQPVPTGFKSLDSALGGGLRVGLTVLVAPPGTGKTSFALAVAHGVAAGGIAACYAGAEIDEGEAFVRMAACHVACDPGLAFQWSAAPVFAAEYEKNREVETNAMVASVFRLNSELGRFLKIAGPEDCATVSSVISVMEDAAADGCRVVVIDYLQELGYDLGGERDAEQVRRTVSALREAALRLRLHVLLVSAMTRESMRKGEVSMHVSSGGAAIEYAAVAFLALRPEEGKVQGDQLARPMTIEVLKNRYGSVTEPGKGIRLKWRPELSYWWE